MYDEVTPVVRETFASEQNGNVFAEQSGAPILEIVPKSESRLSMNGVSALLTELDNTVTYELKTPAEITERDEFPDMERLFLEKRQWVRLQDVVAVAVDLKNSTKLDFKRQARTSARLYEAVTGSCVRIVNKFVPDFVDIRVTAYSRCTTAMELLGGPYVLR